jgi:hypothetical protein
VHGFGKISVGPTLVFLKTFTDLGFTPPELWFLSALVIETLAGISLILGLFTHFFAAASGQRKRLSRARRNATYASPAGIHGLTERWQSG